MLVYFETPYIDKNGERIYYPEAAPPEIHTYAEEYKLKIVQIAPISEKGMYVLFEKK